VRKFDCHKCKCSLKKHCRILFFFDSTECNQKQVSSYFSSLEELLVGPVCLNLVDILLHGLVVERVSLGDLGDEFGLVFEDLRPGLHPLDILRDLLALGELCRNHHDCGMEQIDSLGQV